MPNNPDILIMLDEQLAATEMRVATERDPERVMGWIQAHGELIEFRAQVAARRAPATQGPEARTEAPRDAMIMTINTLIHYHTPYAAESKDPGWSFVDHQEAYSKLLVIRNLLLNSHGLH